jgi:hypothetical protein
MKPNIVTLVLALSLGLGACAGRVANPVSLVQPTDHSASCKQITAEILGNNEKMKALAKEKNWKLAQNVGAGVAGIVVWPLWFAMDLQGTQDVEATALNARQSYLQSLLSSRKC